MSVSLLMLSPLTKGLYRNVILQSGAAPAIATALLVNESKEHAKMFADALRCPTLSDLKNCAMKKNISEIITAQLKVNPTLMLAPFAPVVDGHFLEDTPLMVLTKGSYQDEGSVMIGVTRDEGSLALIYLPGLQEGIPDSDKGLNYSVFVEKVNSTTWVRGQNEEILNSIFQEYTNWADTNDVNATRQGFMDANADAIFKAPAILSAQLYDKMGMRTYFYQMDYSAELDFENKTVPEWRRVPHAADIPYVFGHPLLKYPKDLNNTDVKFGKLVMKYWATFAKTGNPNPSSGQNAVQWPLYTTANKQYLSLKPTPEVKSNLLAARMNFWNSYLGTLKSEKKKPCPEDLTQEPPNEKEKALLGLAIAVGVLGLLVIILIIVIICLKRKLKCLTLYSTNLQ
ncbi:acetylcholinesterase-like [Actinia tenebrosa]|uniref:Acetylcholinesterase-like n=1 Tax=Actinia tenebrosa TaxID=6105 RepID=A0A6P8J1W5_ACTTE|nr:acetylcholinesterase-like [Actinia tenebrosa]